MRINLMKEVKDSAQCLSHKKKINVALNIMTGFLILP